MRIVLAAMVGCSSSASDGEGTETESGLPPMTSTTTSTLSQETLVVPHSGGLQLLALDGSVSASWTWTDLAGSCARCGGEGASPDGDGLLLSFTTGEGGGARTGAIARVDANGDLDFRVDGFGFPHDVIRDPLDDTLIVVETGADALRWIPGDGSAESAVRSLTTSDAQFPGNPNGAERVDVGGRSYLLVSHRPNGDGRITMWDITDGAPTFVWRFPASGHVATPHGPILRPVGSDWWLLWAHTDGQGRNNGTVSLAVTSDPTVAPTYVADLVPGDDVGPFSFFRGVELLTDGRMFLTDSGGGGGPGGGGASGRVIEATFPDLEPPATGESGAYGDQVFVPLGDATEIASGLGMPFEAWYWAR